MPFYTRALILILLASCQLAIAVPIPDDSNQVDNSYSGAGDNGSGGSVSDNGATAKGLFGGVTLLNVLSGNGGRGRLANSGAALTGTHSLHAGIDTESGSPSSENTSNSAHNAYSGSGGVATGGNTVEPAGLINILSGNGGSDGIASSGAAGKSIITTTTSTKKDWKSRE